MESHRVPQLWSGYNKNFKWAFSPEQYFITVLRLKRKQRDKSVACIQSSSGRRKQLPVISSLLSGPLQGFVHGLFILAPTLWAVPLAFGLMVEPHAGEMKPLDGTFIVIAADHLSVGNLLTQAVRRLVWIYGQVRGRHFPLRLPFRSLLLLRWRFGPFFPRGAGFLRVIQTPVAFAIFSVLLAPRALPSGFVSANRTRRGLVSFLVVVAGFAWGDRRRRSRHQGYGSGRRGRRRGNVTFLDFLRGEEDFRVPLYLSGSVFYQFHLKQWRLETLNWPKAEHKTFNHIRYVFSKDHEAIKDSLS